ncbi:hypothetical protein [Micromonospora sp. NBC_00860]|uniref:hypothetical protein n=1 Tax=Micromonospora sp. NBC_00860 TaxID=2975980 RepID=UPI00386C9F80|nr:hypothetical protein OH804_09260 [Micromonospora sp. NBC_00860]
MTSQNPTRRAIWSRVIPTAIALCSLVASTTTGPATRAEAAAPGTDPANPVVTWDLHAQTAIWDVAAQQPNEQVRSFAMVNGAVYDALNAIAGTPYQPYLTAPPSRGTESADAAVAAAATTYSPPSSPLSRNGSAHSTTRLSPSFPTGGRSRTAS